jgi:hypothetical protein
MSALDHAIYFTQIVCSKAWTCDDESHKEGNSAIARLEISNDQEASVWWAGVIGIPQRRSFVIWRITMS